MTPQKLHRILIGISLILVVLGAWMVWSFHLFSGDFVNTGAEAGHSMERTRPGAGGKSEIGNREGTIQGQSTSKPVAAMPQESPTAPTSISPPAGPATHYVPPDRTMRIPANAAETLPSVNPEDLSPDTANQKWIRSTLAQRSMYPPLVQKSQDPRVSWEALSRWGDPQWFSVDPFNRPNPLTTPTYSLGIQLSLGDYLLHRKDPKQRGKIHVFAVAQDSPAWRAGIRKNNLILSYNHIPAEQVNWIKTFQSFQDTAADFTFQDSQGQSHDVHLEPELSTESAELWAVNSDTAILRIRSFNIQTPQRIDHLLESAARMYPRGVKHFFLDLRAPCGELAYVREVGWILMGDRAPQLATIQTRDAPAQPFLVKRPGWLQDTQAELWAQRQSFQVLVNHTTGLSGEILAAAIAKGQHGEILGEPTLGNPYYSVTIRLPKGPLSVDVPAEKIIIDGTDLPLIPGKHFRFDELRTFYLEHGGAF